LDEQNQQKACRRDAELRERGRVRSAEAVDGRSRPDSCIEAVRLEARGAALDRTTTECHRHHRQPLLRHAEPERIGQRYDADKVSLRLFRRSVWADVFSFLDERRTDLSIVLSEFGGIMFSAGPTTCAYSRTDTASGVTKQYSRLLALVRSVGVLPGFCYTQFADTFGRRAVSCSDRTPKFPKEEIVRPTRRRRGCMPVRVNSLKAVERLDPDAGH
jgi:hypothetical protein